MQRPETSPSIRIDQTGLNLLMPMHIAIGAMGQITGVGPTIAKLVPDTALIGKDFFEQFEVRRPSGVTDLDTLQRHGGQRLYLATRGDDLPPMRGIVTADALGRDLLINLSFGVNLVDAVRHHCLTVTDFAATDLAVELLYLVEAKTAVMEELRDLNLRLQGAKVTAEEQALTDTLTGLRNRRALDLELGLLARQNRGFSLMHIDLDYFKAVNDTLGHAAGDHVLKQVAQVLGDETRNGDTVARVGGDEFVIIMPALADARLALQIAERMIARLSVPMEFEGQLCRIAASAGITMSNFYDATDPERMHQDADQALYASKRAGRARATLFAPGLAT